MEIKIIICLVLSTLQVYVDKQITYSLYWEVYDRMGKMGRTQRKGKGGGIITHVDGEKPEYKYLFLVC